MTNSTTADTTASGAGEGGVEIKPCPFCGSASRPARYRDRDEQWWMVACLADMCRVPGPSRDTEEDAIAAWNTRSVEDTLRAQLEAAEARAEAAEADAARLRVDAERWQFALAERSPAWVDEIDAAIDAAKAVTP